MRATAVARAPPPPRPAAARPARPTPHDGRSGGRARVGGPPRGVRLARASSRDGGGAGPSGDDASPSERATVAGTTVKRGRSNALSDGDDEMSVFGKRDDDDDDDDVRGTVCFDVDDATSAWVLCRFFFIWVVFGYVAVPAYALLVDVPVPDLPPKTQAACLLFSEIGKFIAANAMMDAELGPSQTPRRRCFAGGSADEKKTPSLFPSQTKKLLDKRNVTLGLKCGALASVAARGADFIFGSVDKKNDADVFFVELLNASGDETVASSVSSAASSALDLFGSLRFDPAALAAALVASTLVAPVTEELFFRGFLLPAIEKRAPFANGAFANGVTAVVFAAVHFSPKDFPALFVAGAVFGAAQIAARNAQNGLVAPIIAHATFNASVLAEYLWLS
jgi:membrane protease YdiL (CAAX protease family)